MDPAIWIQCFTKVTVLLYSLQTRPASLQRGELLRNRDPQAFVILITEVKCDSERCNYVHRCVHCKKDYHSFDYKVRSEARF